eukprot:scaffold5398_cov70-Skeletonema_marinoi.AAC.7
MIQQLSESHGNQSYPDPISEDSNVRVSSRLQLLLLLLKKDSVKFKAFVIQRFAHSIILNGVPTFTCEVFELSTTCNASVKSSSTLVWLYEDTSQDCLG